METPLSRVILTGAGLLTLLFVSYSPAKRSASRQRVHINSLKLHSTTSPVTRPVLMSAAEHGISWKSSQTQQGSPTTAAAAAELSVCPTTKDKVKISTASQPSGSDGHSDPDPAGLGRAELPGQFGSALMNERCRAWDAVVGPASAGGVGWLIHAQSGSPGWGDHVVGLVNSYLASVLLNRKFYAVVPFADEKKGEGIGLSAAPGAGAPSAVPPWPVPTAPPQPVYSVVMANAAGCADLADLAALPANTTIIVTGANRLCMHHWRNNAQTARLWEALNRGLGSPGTDWNRRAGVVFGCALRALVRPVPQLAAEVHAGLEASARKATALAGTKVDIGIAPTTYAVHVRLGDSHFKGNKGACPALSKKQGALQSRVLQQLSELIAKHRGDGSAVATAGVHSIVTVHADDACIPERFTNASGSIPGLEGVAFAVPCSKPSHSFGWTQLRLWLEYGSTDHIIIAPTEWHGISAWSATALLSSGRDKFFLLCTEEHLEDGCYCDHLAPQHLTLGGHRSKPCQVMTDGVEGPDGLWNPLNFGRPGKKYSNEN